VTVSVTITSLVACSFWPFCLSSGHALRFLAFGAALSNQAMPVVQKSTYNYRHAHKGCGPLVRVRYGLCGLNRNVADVVTHAAPICL
jgi:hypothetical protein